MIGAGLVVNDWCAFTGLDTTATEISVIEATFSALATWCPSIVCAHSLLAQNSRAKTPQPSSARCATHSSTIGHEGLYHTVVSARCLPRLALSVYDEITWLYPYSLQISPCLPVFDVLLVSKVITCESAERRHTTVEQSLGQLYTCTLLQIQIMTVCPNK